MQIYVQLNGCANIFFGRKVREGIATGAKTLCALCVFLASFASLSSNKKYSIYLVRRSMTIPDKYEKLNNPVWHSLTETHQQFSINNDGIKFYHPDFCPFGGANKSQGLSPYLDQYAKLVDNFYVVGDKPDIPPKLSINKELVCLQMVLEDRITVQGTEKIFSLNQGYTEELFELVNLVQPGYFRSKTVLLGDYFGIYQDGKLIAAAGERMQMNEFVEVSAIVTHPEYNGKGYAKQLTAYTVNNIFSKQKVPYLHVAKSNLPAINLYKKLGFETRSEISFWNINKRGE